MDLSQKKNKICLTMIVKNETHVLQKCFDSLYSFIDYFIICDTGSSDGTQQFIKEYFEKKQIPGNVFDCSWVDFGYNRSEVFQKADSLKKKHLCNYYLVIDADDVLKGSLNTFLYKEHDSAIQGFYLKILLENTTSIEFKRIQLFNNLYSWQYKGVLHEYPECLGYTESKIDKINDCFIVAGLTGARNNVSKIEKYQKDAAILLKSFGKTNNSRDCFYLANSYYDAEDFKNAIVYYKKRTEMGGWEEEIYYCHYRYALCKYHLKDEENISETDLYIYFLKAYFVRPTRLESLYFILSDCRKKENYHLGYSFGMFAKENLFENTNDCLFVDVNIHKFNYIDELAICAYYVGNYVLSLELNNKLINMYEKKEIQIDIDRIIKNKSFSLEKLNNSTWI